MIDVPFIRQFLEEVEGKGIARGYVPKDSKGEPLGASGVTVGTGVDLGQQSRASLAQMGVPQPLINRLGPYLGQNRREAMYILAREPLTLPPEEVDMLDGIVHARYIDETARLFGREAFEAAPREAQAVAVSLHYQFGQPSRKDWPGLGNTWRNLQRGRYAEAAACLSDLSDWAPKHRVYRTRRNTEAALLEKIR